jgi:hypothetical protein
VLWTMRQCRLPAQAMGCLCAGLYYNSRRILVLTWYIEDSEVWLPWISQQRSRGGSWSTYIALQPPLLASHTARSDFRVLRFLDKAFEPPILFQCYDSLSDRVSGTYGSDHIVCVE